MPQASLITEKSRVGGRVATHHDHGAQTLAGYGDEIAAVEIGRKGGLEIAGGDDVVNEDILTVLPEVEFQCLGAGHREAGGNDLGDEGYLGRWRKILGVRYELSERRGEKFKNLTPEIWERLCERLCRGAAAGTTHELMVACWISDAPCATWDDLWDQ